MAQSDAGLWQVLAEHAGGIQAVAAVVSVAAVLVLAVLGWRAIAAVRRIATAVEDQLAAQRAHSAARQGELIALVQMFSRLLADLPTSREDADALRSCALWDEHDLTRIQRLAAEESPQCGERAALAGAPVRWLRERIAEVKAIRPDVAVRWDHFPWSRWEEELDRARARIGETGTLAAGGEVDLRRAPPKTPREAAPTPPPVARVSSPVAVG